MSFIRKGFTPHRIAEAFWILSAFSPGEHDAQGTGAIAEGRVELGNGKGFARLSLKTKDKHGTQPVLIWCSDHDCSIADDRSPPEDIEASGWSKTNCRNTGGD